MRVNGTGQGSTERSRETGKTDRAGESSSKKSKTRTASIDAGDSTKVAISGKGKEAAKAKEIANATADIDEAKVARLKAQIQNGTYKVDAERLADRMVDEHMLTSF